MKLWALILSLALTGCLFQKEPIPVKDESIVVSGYSQEDLAEFKRINGSDFDPNSKLDKEKMDIIQDKPSVKPTPKPPISPIEPLESDLSISTRDKVIKSAEGLIGLREPNGNNRSPMIDKMNKFVGAPLGSPWCAAWNAWNYNEGGVKNYPKSAWSPDWVQSPTWTRKSGGKNPLPADAFGIYFQSKGRIAHTGLIAKWGDKSATTLEGNTGPSGVVPGSAGDREGDGSYKKFRLKSQIYSVRNWIGD